MMPWLGIITAMVRVAQETREMSSPSAFGNTSATFQVCGGTVTWPFAIVIDTPPLLPVPPTPTPPATM